jgi:dTMP kinase
MNKKGKFVAIEGIDGSGTTTQTRLLSEALNARGIAVIPTAEPSDGVVGDLIRQILDGDAAVPPETLALLFAADRVEHYWNLIKPAIDKGVWVVSDRYLLSSIAYQSLHCDPKWVRAINSRVAVPDITVLCDIEVEEALSRLESRGTGRQIFEKKKILEKVRRNYLDAAKDPENGPVIVIDASAPVEKVHENILQLLTERFFI